MTLDKKTSLTGIGECGFRFYFRVEPKQPFFNECWAHANAEHFVRNLQSFCEPGAKDPCNLCLRNICEEVVAQEPNVVEKFNEIKQYAC